MKSGDLVQYFPVTKRVAVSSRLRFWIFTVRKVGIRFSWTFPHNHSPKYDIDMAGVKQFEDSGLQFNSKLKAVVG